LRRVICLRIIWHLMSALSIFGWAGMKWILPGHEWK
jgi:hypothetical protein